METCTVIDVKRILLYNFQMGLAQLFADGHIHLFNGYIPIIGLLVYRNLSVAFAGESGPVRYDKLCPGEVRDLLLCFLHILKHIPESHLLSWWLTLSHQTLTSFFTLLQ